MMCLGTVVLQLSLLLTAIKLSSTKTTKLVGMIFTFELCDIDIEVKTTCSVQVIASFFAEIAAFLVERSLVFSVKEKVSIPFCLPHKISIKKLISK